MCVCVRGREKEREIAWRESTGGECIEATCEGRESSLELRSAMRANADVITPGKFLHIRRTSSMLGNV